MPPTGFRCLSGLNPTRGGLRCGSAGTARLIRRYGKGLQSDAIIFLHGFASSSLRDETNSLYFREITDFLLK